MKLDSKKIFYIFMVLQLILWTCAGYFLKDVVSIDSMEAITWGELISFGTNKHPPLSGWIMSGLYNLCGHFDLLTYLLGQICLFVGYIYVYKLAKFFLDEEKAFCSVMILQACSYYTWMVFVNSFNCNILLMALWPIVVYYFYKAVRFDKTYDWLLFGIFSGLSFLGKYQIAFLFVAIACYMIFVERRILLNKKFYLAILTGLLVISPHVIWLCKTDFFSFGYMIERTQSETHNLPYILVKLSHIFYPLKFIFGQIIALVGCFVMYLILAFESKNISFKNDGQKCDKLFLLIIGIVPVLAHGLMGLFTGERVPSVWGSIMVSMSGILLFYFFPVKFNNKTFLNFTKLTVFTVLAWITAIFWYMNFETEMVLSYPHKKIMDDFNQIWTNSTGIQNLKYVYGANDYVFQFKHYNSYHPTVILDTFSHKNPWIDYDDVKKSGALIVAEKSVDILPYVNEFSLYLPKNEKSRIQKYSYLICNKFNNCSVKDISYVIVKPEQ